ncbi:MAG: dihydroneopterin aldolase [Chitinophagaceae bacterium]
MISIELQNIRMHAFHGIFEGEKKTGSNYELTIKVSYEEGNSRFEDIKETISYTEIFAIIKQRMKISTPLLEKVADSIIKRIRHQFPNTREISISIYKLEAPIENFEGKIGITMHKKFND